MSDASESRFTIEVEHIKIASTKSFAEAKAALERLVPEIDPAIGVLLREGDRERALKALEAGPVLARFLSRDHGSLLQIAGRPRKAVQYDIGNPLTASRMTRHQLPAALYAPLRVLLYENETGRSIFEYDRPSSLFGQFDDERVTAVARELDTSLERVLISAAS